MISKKPYLVTNERHWQGLRSTLSLQMRYWLFVAIAAFVVMAVGLSLGLVRIGDTLDRFDWLTVIEACLGGAIAGMGFVLYRLAPSIAYRLCLCKWRDSVEDS